MKMKILKKFLLLFFPEFCNLNRLNRLTKIFNYSKIDRDLLLAILLIDEKNSHEYFGHKYNISSYIKDNLELLAKNLGHLKENKNFFTNDLEKNIYLYNKNHLINLNILNFAINTKYKFKDFSKIFNRILRSKTPKFTIDGKYLMKNGMQQGSLIGKVLRKIEEEWIKNNFKISKERIKQIIELYSS